MNLNYKNLIKYSVFMFIGIVLIIYGALSLVFDKDDRAMTDQEITNRARELGMVDLNEAYAKWSDEYKLKLEEDFKTEKEMLENEAKDKEESSKSQ
ncbi:MAG: hypothetical protein WBA54_11970 [Acidaminobacteraceae bacterium]